MATGCIFGTILAVFGYLGVIGLLLISLLLGVFGINSVVSFPQPVEATFQVIQSTLPAAEQTRMMPITPTPTPQP